MARSDFGFQIGSALATNYLTDSKYVRAGYTAVDTIAERDALPVDTGSGGVIVKGSKCHVAADDKDYIYNGTAWEEESSGGNVDDVLFDDVSAVGTDKKARLYTDEALKSAKETGGIGWKSGDGLEIEWDGLSEVIGTHSVVTDFIIDSATWQKLYLVSDTVLSQQQVLSGTWKVYDNGTVYNASIDESGYDTRYDSDNKAWHVCSLTYNGTTKAQVIIVEEDDTTIANDVNIKHGTWFRGTYSNWSTEEPEVLIPSDYVSYFLYGTITKHKIDPETYLDTTEAGEAGKALLSDGNGGVTWGDAGKVDDVLFDGVTAVDPTDKKAKLYTDAALASAKATGGIGYKSGSSTTISWDHSTEGKDCVMITDDTEGGNHGLYKISDTVPAMSSVIGGTFKYIKSTTSGDTEITIDALTSTHVVQESEKVYYIYGTEHDYRLVVVIADDTHIIADDGVSYKSITSGVWFSKKTSSSESDPGYLVNSVSYGSETTHKIDPETYIDTTEAGEAGKALLSDGSGGVTWGDAGKVDDVLFDDVTVVDPTDKKAKLYTDAALASAKQTGGIGYQTGGTNTVTWDGDTTGKDTITINDVSYYKISTLTPAKANMVGATLVISQDGTELSTPITSDLLSDLNSDVYTVSNNFIVATVDSTVGTTSITSGMWFAKIVEEGHILFDKSLTWSDVVISKIDPAYLNSGTTTADKTLEADGNGGVKWGDPKITRGTSATAGHFPMYKSNGDLEDSGVFFDDEDTSLTIPGDKPVVYNYDQSSIITESEKGVARINIKAAGTEADNSFTGNNTFSNLSTHTAGILIGSADTKAKLSQDSTSNGLKIENVDVYINEKLYATELRLTGLEKLTNRDTGDRLINPNSGTSSTQTLQTLTLDGITYKLAGSALAVDSYQALVTAFNALDAQKYDVGQSIFVKTLNVPDLWIYNNNESTKVEYTYVSDDQFISDLHTAGGALQIGYYKVAQLEIEKVDLTNYVQFDNYASATKAGVIFAEASTDRDNVEVHINSDHKLVVSTPKVIYL